MVVVRGVRIKEMWFHLGFSFGITIRIEEGKN
jgi:hypothetical protein